MTKLDKYEEENSILSKKENKGRGRSDKEGKGEASE